MNHAAQTLTMAVSFWGYISLLPTIIVGAVVLAVVWRKD